MIRVACAAHPWARPRVVAALHGHGALVGLAAAGPLAAVVAHLVGRFPGVDAALFDDGGLLLAEVLRALRGSDLRRLAGFAALALGVGAISGAAVSAGVIQALADPAPRSARSRLGVALRATPSLVAVLALELAARAVVVAVLGTAARAILRGLDLSPPRADLAVLAALGGLLAVDGVVRVFGDLARASAAARRRGVFEALGDAASAFGRRPVGLPLAHALRGASAVALALAGALIGVRIGMRSGASAAAAVAVLELALLAGTCLRLGWLSVAVRAVAIPPPPMDAATTSALPAGADSTRESAAEPR